MRKKRLSLLISLLIFVCFLKCDGGGSGVGTGSVPVSGVALNKNSLVLKIGDTEQLTATVSPANATNKNVSWSSSRNNIANVTTDGLIKGIAEGTANITVTTEDGGFKATCTVTVGDDIKGKIVNWRILDPPRIGQIKKIVINTNDQSQIYVIKGPYTSLYKTDNNGQTWNEILENADLFTVAPSNPDILYASGWKSTNGGDSWTTIEAFPSNTQVLIDPANPNILYSSINGGDIYKTTDGGDSWNYLSNIGVGGYVKIAINPDTTSEFYAYGNNSYICKSTDTAANWSVYYQYPESVATRGFQTKILVYNDKVYTVYGDFDSSGEAFIIKIENSGVITATELTNLNDTYEVKRINDIKIYGAKIYAATDKGLFMSGDDGNSWDRITSDFDYLNTVDISGGKICIGSDNAGISSSSTGSYDWENIGIETSTGITIPYRNDQITIMNVSSSCFKLKSDNQTWKSIIPPAGYQVVGNSTQTIYIPTKPSTVYCIRGIKLFKSDDLGETWSYVSEALAYIYSGSMKNPMVGSNDASKLFFRSGTSSLTRSLDYGSSWATRSVPGSMSDMLYSDNGVLYITVNNLPYYSIDNGDSWNLLDEGLPASVTNWMDTFYYDHSNNDRLFGCAYDPEDGLYKIFEKPGGSLEWQLFYSNTEPLTYLNGKIDTSLDGSTIFVAGAEWIGVWKYWLFFTQDNGNTWEKIDFNGSLDLYNYKYVIQYPENTIWHLSSDVILWLGDIVY